MFECAPYLHMRDFHNTTVIKDNLNPDDQSNNCQLVDYQEKGYPSLAQCLMKFVFQFDTDRIIIQPEK